MKSAAAVASFLLTAPLALLLTHSALATGSTASYQVTFTFSGSNRPRGPAVLKLGDGTGAMVKQALSPAQGGTFDKGANTLTFTIQSDNPLPSPICQLGMSFKAGLVWPVTHVKISGTDQTTYDSDIDTLNLMKSQTPMLLLDRCHATASSAPSSVISDHQSTSQPSPLQQQESTPAASSSPTPSAVYQVTFKLSDTVRPTSPMVIKFGDGNSDTIVKEPLDPVRGSLNANTISFTVKSAVVLSAPICQFSLAFKPGNVWSVKHLSISGVDNAIYDYDIDTTPVQSSATPMLVIDKCGPVASIGPSLAPESLVLTTAIDPTKQLQPTQIAPDEVLPILTTNIASATEAAIVTPTTSSVPTIDEISPSASIDVKDQSVTSLELPAITDSIPLPTVLPFAPSPMDMQMPVGDHKALIDQAQSGISIPPSPTLSPGVPAVNPTVPVPFDISSVSPGAPLPTSLPIMPEVQAAAPLPTPWPSYSTGKSSITVPPTSPIPPATLNHPTSPVTAPTIPRVVYLPMPSGIPSGLLSGRTFSQPLSPVQIQALQFSNRPGQQPSVISSGNLPNQHANRPIQHPAVTLSGYLPNQALQIAPQFQMTDYRAFQPLIPVNTGYRSAGVAGGVSPIQITPELMQKAAMALAQVEPHFTLLRILQVQQQVVAGTNYFFRLAARTPLGQVEEVSCRVFDQPWTRTFQVTRM